MSGPENFLSRWSRRKSESPKDAEFSTAQPDRDERKTKPSDAEATPAVPLETAEPTPGAFDPASLPSIESIAAETDIRAFLQRGVPAELTRTALRRAWVADPAIRDFIGIAENQWDFNDPGAMPGFGPLGVADAEASLAARLAGGAGSIPEAPPVIPQVAPAGPVDELRRTHAHPPESVAEAEIAGLVEERNEENVAGEHGRATAENRVRRHPRSHGGALPR
jgi:hypothetical protein